MSVSLCLMVRNEEEKLATCLQSAADLVDETVVVDTGSTDGTREQAAKLRSRVFEFPWCDDFAAARNESIRHATSDFIFWMDADERVDEANRQKLRKLFQSLPHQPEALARSSLTLRAGVPPIQAPPYGADHPPNDRSPNDHSSLISHHSSQSKVAFVMKCLSVQPGETRHGTVVDHVRLFRNLPDIRWKYRVHEQILPALRATGAEVIFTDIVIQHTGYVDPAFTRQKLERNLRLLHLDHTEHPKDPYILFHLGWGYLELNRLPEAIAFLRASLEGSHPGDSIVKKTFALLAQAHHRLGQPNDALAACRMGRARNPVDLELLYLQGILHRERREWSQAIGCLQKLVSSQESVVSSQKESETGVARPERREGREEAPSATTPFEDSGRATQTGRATQIGRGTPTERVTQPTAHHSQLTTHSSKGQFGSADVGLNGYLARHQLALVYYQQGRLAEAEAEWKLALSDRPGYFDALKGLGEMYLKLSRWLELDGVVERLADQGNEGQILQARGMLARKEFEAARSVLELMVADQPGSVYPRVILSHVYLQEGKDLRSAERVLREIVQLDPSQAESWRNLAVLLREQGRLDEAKEVCHTGWRHCPTYATLPLLLGITLADQRDLAGAEMCFLRLLELPYAGPIPDEHIEARHQLALIYQKTGHPAEAEAQWRTILAERPDHAPAIQAMKQSTKSNGVLLRGPVESRPNGKPSPEDNDLASIIILCCNQLEYTRQCLESVLANTRQPYELILVDNGSTDGTSPADPAAAAAHAPNAYPGEPTVPTGGSSRLLLNGVLAADHDRTTMTPMSQNQPQGSTFSLRAQPHCRLQAPNLCAWTPLVPSTNGDFTVLNDTSFSIRRLHRLVPTP